MRNAAVDSRAWFRALVRLRRLTRLGRKQDSRLPSPNFYFTTYFLPVNVSECFSPSVVVMQISDDLQELEIVLLF